MRFMPALSHGMGGVVSKRRLIKRMGIDLSVRSVSWNGDTVRQDTREKSPTFFVRRLFYKFFTAAILRASILGSSLFCHGKICSPAFGTFSSLTSGRRHQIYNVQY